MHFKFITSALTLLCILLFGISSRRFPNNPPNGHSGAPGEQACMSSGCHGGGSFAGTIKMTGLPDTVLPNETYQITLVGNSSTATRGGFMMTALNGTTNSGIGTFSAAAGVSIGTSGGKQYPRQSSPKVYASGQVSWTFPWKAPATATDPRIRFYWSHLLANGDGDQSGDNSITNADTVILRTSVSTQDPQNAHFATFTYASDMLQITLENVAQAQLQIVSLSGAHLVRETIGKEHQFSTVQLPVGMYLASVTANGHTKTYKFMKLK